MGWNTIDQLLGREFTTLVDSVRFRVVGYNPVAHTIQLRIGPAPACSYAAPLFFCALWNGAILELPAPALLRAQRRRPAGRARRPRRPTERVGRG